MRNTTIPVNEMSPKTWAMQQFASCQLGDSRRTKRLVDFAARQVQNPHGSIYENCRGETAVIQGAYRLVENDNIEPEAIEEG